MPYFSIVIPVYNRPQEVRELLDSLALQANKDFEVVIVEDGSWLPCKRAVERFESVLPLKYFYKENSGPGLSRNYGAERSCGEYVIFLDSDCVVPEQYTEVLWQFCHRGVVDAFGGPDRADASFSKIQKAINYSMTSFFTTGGIRGRKQSLEKFHPRSFNMGFSRAVLEATGGFSGLRFGEDIDMSIRIMEAGFQTCLVPEAYVFHKRRTSFRQFFKQVFHSGMARIDLYLLHPQSLKLVHCFPSAFAVGTIAMLLSSLFWTWALLPLGVYVLAVFVGSLLQNGNILVACLSVAAAFVQLFGYGIGFLRNFFVKIVVGQRAVEKKRLERLSPIR